MAKHVGRQRLGRTVLVSGLVGLFFLGTLLGQSLADLARQQRARKAQEGRPARVFTNDDISRPTAAPTMPVSDQGKKAAEGEKDAAREKKESDKKEGAKSAEESAKDQSALEKEYREKFAKAREQVEIETKKFDVMQRELNLSQTQYYSDPNVALREQTFRGEINQRSQEIEQQKAAVEKANQAVSDLEEELRKNGLPASWAR